MQLSVDELRLFIRGLWRTQGSWAQKKRRIYTSSAELRDQLLQVLLHCGYSAYTQLAHPAGTIKATADCWVVAWTGVSDAHNESSSMPTLRRQRDVTTQPYDPHHDGRLWCVEVSHPDHLIFAQRAHREGGVVTKQSRPIIVGNCVAEGSLVALANGTSVPIEDVRVGAEVLSYWREGEAEGLMVRKVSDVLDQGVKKCVELLFSDGRTLVCTADHLIRTADGRWVEAGELVEGTDEVAVGVEPIVALWRLRTRQHLGYDLDMGDRAPHSLAFARLLGYLLTDGSVAAERGRMSLGDQVDVAAVQRDVYVLTGRRPAVRRTSSTFEVTIPHGLHRLFVQVGADSGKRAGQISRFPAFVTAADCPLPVVREFLGGLFGGDGLTPCLSHSDMALTGLGFCTTRQCDEAAVQITVLKEELHALLHRCDVDCTSNVTWSFETVAPNMQTAAGAAEYAEVQEQEMVAAPTRTAATLDSSKSYVLKCLMDTALVTAFARGVGFRYCAHKQHRLVAAAAAAYLRSNELFLQQKPQLTTCINALRSDSAMSMPAAAKQVEAELAEQEQLRSVGKKKGGGDSLDKRLHIDGSFSEAPVKKPYKAADRLAEISAEASTEDDTASATSPAERRRAGSDPVPSSHGVKDQPIEQEDEEEEGDDDTEGPYKYRSTDPVGHGVNLDADIRPLFRVRLIGRRELEKPLRVYDLTVPSPQGHYFASFLANGVVVHNCAPVWDSARRKYVGLLSVSDFLDILLATAGEVDRSAFLSLSSQRLCDWAEFKRRRGTSINRLLCISPESTLHEAVRQLLNYRVHRLCVVQLALADTILRILSNHGILRFLRQSCPQFYSVSIRDLGIGVFENLVTLTPSTPIGRAMEMLSQYRVSSIPVVDAQNRPIDVYSRSDIRFLAADATWTNLDLSIEAALAPHQHSRTLPLCTRDDSLMTVSGLLVSCNKHSLICVNGQSGVVEGVVSLTDIFSFILDSGPPRAESRIAALRADLDRGEEGGIGAGAGMLVVEGGGGGGGTGGVGVGPVVEDDSEMGDAPDIPADEDYTH